jgi:DNA-binding NarL/FixJ family response regulator
MTGRMGGGCLRDKMILVVDDDVAIRGAIVTMLADAGYPTCEAGSGAEALRSARSIPPALVLLDVNLPGICGYEVYRRLRDEFGMELPIVFVSGERTTSFDRVGGLLLGADDYIVKPFAEDELLARVQAQLARGQAHGVRTLASRLTPRELEILRLLAHGLSPIDISLRLTLSPKTVGAHVEHVYMKLGVQTRAQAVAIAYRSEIFPTAERNEALSP